MRKIRHVSFAPEIEKRELINDRVAYQDKLFASIRAELTTFKRKEIFGCSLFGVHPLDSSKRRNTVLRLIDDFTRVIRPSQRQKIVKEAASQYVFLNRINDAKSSHADKIASNIAYATIVGAPMGLALTKARHRDEKTINVLRSFLIDTIGFSKTRDLENPEDGKSGYQKAIKYTIETPFNFPMELDKLQKTLNDYTKDKSARIKSKPLL